MSTEARQFAVWQNGNGKNRWHVAERTPKGLLKESTHLSETRALRNIIKRLQGEPMFYVTIPASINPLIQRWQAAYTAAWGKPAPEVTLDSGWYTIDSWGNRHRRKQFEQMCINLEERVRLVAPEEAAQ